MVKKSEMIAEAVERLKLLKICEKDIRSYEDSQKIPCYFVNHEERKLWKKRLDPGAERRHRRSGKRRVPIGLLCNNRHGNVAGRIHI